MPAIVIVSVIDTREFVEQGDRWVPIPGSGDSRECDRCGRAHEVHATIVVDGKTLVTGTGCMGLGDKEARKVATKASTVAKHQAQLKGLKARLEAAEAAEKAVNALPVPAIVEGVHEKGFKVLTCGDSGSIWCQFAKTAADLVERRETAVRSWRSNRYNELCKDNRHSLLNQIEDTERRLARAAK